MFDVFVSKNSLISPKSKKPYRAVQLFSDLFEAKRFSLHIRFGFHFGVGSFSSAAGVSASLAFF
jgi:hypothetical protein